MPKINYNPEKVQKQKKMIGTIAIILLLVITVIAIALRINLIIWIVLDLIIFGAAKLLQRRIGKVPL